MKKVYVFLADGFEELEAFAPVDILRRGGVIVKTVSINEDTVVRGARDVGVIADMKISDTDFKNADMIVLPGGAPGYKNLAASKKLKQIIEFMDTEKRFIGAICASPAAVLGQGGFLKEKIATCYPGMESLLCCKEVSNEGVVVDGHIITSKSAATATDFAFCLLELLTGKENTQKIKESIVYNG